MSMTDFLQLKASAGTYVIPRRRENTETPEQIEHTKEPGQSKFSGSTAPTPHAGMLTFVSGDKDYSTPPSGGKAPIVSPPQNQADAIFETPGADLSARLRRVLLAIASSAPPADILLFEVMTRPFDPGVSIAQQRFPGLGLGSAQLPETDHEAENRYIRFRSRLIATLLGEPIEDGVTHPAEGLIDEALRADSSDCQDWLSQVLVEHYPTRPSLCASIVRCIGRLDYDRVRGWGMHLADDALRHEDVEVRESAIRALEAWGGSAALDMLRRHQDTEAWLKEYVQQVIVDLSGTAS